MKLKKKEIGMIAFQGGSDMVDNFPILYEDNHIIVVVKPENVLSQEDITEDDDMLSIVKKYLKEKYQKPGNVYLGLVHRLDRRVGGVMIFAKTSKAASRLSEDIRNHNFHKEYYAIVKGKIDKSGSLTDYVIKEESEKNHKAMIVNKDTTNAKRAILDYQFIKGFKIKDIDFTLIKINLITGRYNQIRLQLSNFGYPIVDDYKYGYTGENFNDMLGLWCYKIRFNHPVLKREMEFSYIIKDGIWSFI